MPKLILNRREFAVGSAALVTAMSSLPVMASGKLKVAGIYTVPTQQKWVARLHLALDRQQSAVRLTMYIQKAQLIQTMLGLCVNTVTVA